MSSNSAPLLHVLTGGNKSLEGPLFRAMIRACLLAGRVYIAIAFDTGVIAGLALWFPPGKVLWKKKIIASATSWSLCHPRPENGRLPLMVLHWPLSSKRRCLLV